ncbi:hypothetical protein OWV82_026580 [Melia azedarach]|nr:hypothetical protein OWV82_026580 [Melia azedarach]
MVRMKCSESRRRGRFARLRRREKSTEPLSFRGRRSRNKVSVGDPAEGSLSKPAQQNDPRTRNTTRGGGATRAASPPSPLAPRPPRGRDPSRTPGGNNEPRRELRQGKSNERERAPGRRPGHGARPGMRRLSSPKSKTDSRQRISRLSHR